MRFGNSVKRGLPAAIRRASSCRVDMTVETPTDVYLIEFKLDDTAANAIAQIREKDYAAPFALSQKRITLIGLGFSSEKRTVTDSAVEQL